MAGVHDERLRRALKVLDEAGDEPVTFAELRAAGVDDPAATVYELELAGEPIEHLRAAVRLGPSAPTAPDTPRRRRLRLMRRHSRRSDRAR